MPTHYQRLKVFLSYAYDVEHESRIAESTIQHISKRVPETLGLSLDTYNWRQHAPVTPEIPETKIQDELNKELAKCDIFLLLLWRRWGSCEEGHKKSNLEREIDLALDCVKKKKPLQIVSYFRELPPNADKGNQEKKVTALRNRLRREGVWVYNYSDPQDFAARLPHDLYDILLTLHFSSKKQRALRRFWQFGVPDRPSHPRLAVIYPPTDRSYEKAEEPDRFWHRRLVPNVVFEDFKCLQKIEKTLRRLSFRDFRVYTTANVPNDVQYLNRAWLCLPRNGKAAKQLKKYSASARFRFPKPSNRGQTKLYWKTSEGSEIEVRSPLGKYLREQRAVPSGPWTRDKGDLVARDYAILARFSDSNTEAMEQGVLKDYFFAGIRGLGTWGVGWFIDRRYSFFKDLEENEEIQLLLEVTYQDGRIKDVRDVSEENSEYFRQQNAIRQVRQVIKSGGDSE